MENEAKDWKIYCLIDPNTNAVRYVGFSNDVNRRLNHHLRDARLNRLDHHLHRWLKTIGRPEVQILETDLTWKMAGVREVYWIDVMKQRGEPLTNTHPGGKGGRPKGFKMSEESRQKISEANRGRRHSEETKRKMSESGKGKIRSPEHCRRLSEAARGRVPWNKKTHYGK